MPEEVVKYPTPPKEIIKDAPMTCPPNNDTHYVIVTPEADGFFSYQCNNEGNQQTNVDHGKTENLSPFKKNSLGQNNEKRGHTEYSSKQQNSKLNSSDDYIGYPLSPEIIEKKLGQDGEQDELGLSGETQTLNLINKGNGTSSIDSNIESRTGDVPKNMGERISTEDKIKTCSTGIQIETVNSHNNTSVASTHQEGHSVLRHSESADNDHERLGLETPSGKLSKIVIIAAESSMRVFYNPKFTRNLVEESVFVEYLRGPIEIRGKGKSIKIEIDSKAKIDVSKVKTLGEIPVHVWCPLSTEQRVGVISPVDLTLDVDTQFTPFLKLDSNSASSAKILDVKRMRKFVDLPCVRVVFEGNNLPERVIYRNTVLRVRPFIHNPTLCYKCRNFGHGASSCTNRITCPRCLAHHNWNECPSYSDPKCLHCKLVHETGSVDCDFFIQASKIENMKRNGEISYEQSKTLYNTLNKCSLSQVRDDISRGILRGWESNYRQTNTQSPREEMIRTNSAKSRDNRSVPSLSLRNYFEPLENINDDPESIRSSDNDNGVSFSPDCIRPSVNSAMTGRKICNTHWPKPKRRFKTYDQSLSSCELEPVSDDSFCLDPSNNKVHSNDRTVHDKSIPEKFDSNRPRPKPRTSLKEAKSFADSFMKDSFLYELMYKIRSFYRLPKKTGFQWVSFLIELFDFVGSYGEEEE